MSGGVSLVMPMAGRGSRFARAGETRPKPLIELAGAPFFWWACESLRRAVPVEEMVFVVLAEHCRDHGIDRAILFHYPQARIVALPEVTAGAAETAMLGVKALRSRAPVAINDCDHAFRAPDMGRAVEDMRAGRIAGALLGFASQDPAYSYMRLDAQGAVCGTVEKQVVSPHAIAGCYWFASPDEMQDRTAAYRASCPYPELFMSGLYNQMLAEGARIGRIEARRHVSFGTPEECARLDPVRFAADFGPAPRKAPPA